MLTDVKAWLRAHVKLLILLAVVVVLAFGGVRWCKPRPPKTVEQVTQPAKDKIDRATEDRLRSLLAERERALAKQRAENLRLRQVAEAKAAAPFKAAMTGGSRALADLGTVWTAPGTAAQLRGRWRAVTDSPD